jgi:predicted nucleic acid-binding Zn ribbon protein
MAIYPGETRVICEECEVVYTEDDWKRDVIDFNDDGIYGCPNCGCTLGRVVEARAERYKGKVKENTL